MCAPDRRNVAPLAALAGVAPALMLSLEHLIKGPALGLSAEFWKGMVIGTMLGLQIVALAFLVRGRRGVRRPADPG